jgi:phage terminase large subunit-like protein
MRLSPQTLARIELIRRQRTRGLNAASEAALARNRIRSTLLELARQSGSQWKECTACQTRDENPPPHACLTARGAYLATLSEFDRAWASQLWMASATASQCPPPGDWDVWLSLRGRGAGKTWTGASQVIEHAYEYGARARIGIVTRTSRSTDTETVTSGPSGILTISPRDFVPRFIPSRNYFVWPNGAQAFMFSAEEPAQLRGPAFTFIWVDELASWEKLGPDGKTPAAWDQLQFGLREKGGPCQIIATTTPLPTAFIREMLTEPGVAVTSGTMFSNRHNLSERYIRKMLRKYGGTRLGRQELYGDILDDAPGALFTHALIEAGRRSRAPQTLVRVVVAIDPAVSTNASSNETGIVIVGIDEDGELWILADMSGSYSPEEWARVAIQAYVDWSADAIVAETNNGGDLVERNIRAFKDEEKGLNGEDVSYEKVTASRGKAIRAEPISALYEQGRVHHVGVLEKLEDQMCTWSPLLDPKHESSPDRMDALVWGCASHIDDGHAEVVHGAMTANYNFEDAPA